MQKIFLLALFLLTGNLIFAQNGSVEGTITDANTNQPLIGVSVTIKGGGKGTSSDLKGYYSIKNIKPGSITLVFSYGGAVKEVTDIEITADNTSLQDVNIEQHAKTVEGVVVTSSVRARQATAAALITFQKNTNTVASVISAETIRRSPDRNTGEILKRTPSASIRDGKYLIVRGLADRYNQAMLNGILLTSTEPDRKTFSFDLIPAQIIDNVIINKAFVPELPGEWSGGLIQVNTKDIPASSFLNVQVGVGYNTQTTFKDFQREQIGGSLDWLGIDNGKRALPSLYTTKSNFDTSNRALKTQVGRLMRNSWSPKTATAPLNHSFQLNGGLNSKLFGKQMGGVFNISYNKNYRYQDLYTGRNYPNGTNTAFTTENFYNDDKYIDETIVGAMAGLGLQLNTRNKISLTSLINVVGSNAVNSRNGIDRARNDSIMNGYEFTFKQNTFFTAQLTGDHGINNSLRLKWYGSFNVLDGYTPDQRRILYSRETPSETPLALISNTLSQQSGSRIYQSLSDYIYTGGGDLAYTFKAFNNLKQTVKGGYMIQVKDRLYDAQLFANYLPLDNPTLRALSPDKIFTPENFGNGYDNKFAFDAIKNRNFRYMANTILNAGFIQMDNQFTEKLRLVYGLRVEHYDQLVGSVKTWDPRHTYSKVLDWLPGANLTYKLNNLSNIRLSGSKTVIRPELRELSALNLYDFELNASVQGKPTLKRTGILNADLRYELYPRGGEVFSVGVFYKQFKDPIEQYYNDGAGGASTFSFQNAEKAYAAGVEVEVRKKLDVVDALKNFTAQANVSLIKSEVTDTTLKIKRPLQGQSNYVVNAGLMYDMPSTGLQLTTLFNIIGKRIYLVGDFTAGSPDVYEASRPVLDFQAAKKVLKEKGEIKLTIGDLLNRTQYFYQNLSPEKNLGLDKGTDAYRFTRRFGTTYSLTFNYSL